MSNSGYSPATGPLAATLIETPANGLLAGTVEIPCSDGMIPAYRAMPAGASGCPVLLVVQEIFGLHEHIRDICRRLAHLGYMALAPELFLRQGDVSGLNSFDAIRPIVARVPDAQVLADLDATLACALARGGDGGRLGITGFCWGGRIVWLYAAQQPALKAAVAWYGRLQGQPNPLQPQHPLDVAAQLRVPVLGLYGGDDASISMDSIECMRQALAAAGGASQIKVYPGTPHAFLADYRPSYRAGPASDGWQHMLDWFAGHGLGPAAIP